MKCIVNLMKVLGLAPIFLYEKVGFVKYTPSTLLCIYNGMMLLILMFNRLGMIFVNSFNGNMENVNTYSAMMQNSPYVISHSCFLFSTFLFLGEVFNFLHVLFSLNSSIYFTFISNDSNFNYVKAQISVLVPLHTLNAFPICIRIEKKNYPQFCLCVIMAYLLIQLMY